MSDSAVPTLIGDRYEVGELLGRGGMAEVYAGTDRRLMRPVAIKLLQERMAVRPDIRTRFETEAQSAARLSHPAAVAVYDTGEHDGVPYIVMERLPGETLADRIAAGPVDPEWLRGVSVEVLSALAAAHAVGLVHRDVKPGNILVTADGHAKIADFGIAKSVDPTAAEGSPPAPMADLTGTGQLLGTPAYLSPERIQGRPATASSDIYALGVVLYEALAGVKPYSGDTALVTAGKVVAGDHVPLGTLAPGLDPALVVAVETAMSAEPAARFGTAGEMASALVTTADDATVALGADATLVPDGTTVLEAADLAEFRSHQTAPAVAAAPVAAAAARARTAHAANRAPGSFAGRRRPPVAWLVVLAGIVVLALLLVAQLGDDGSPSTAKEVTTLPAPSVPSTVSTVTTLSPVTTLNPNASVATVQPPTGRKGRGKHD